MRKSSLFYSSSILRKLRKSCIVENLCLKDATSVLRALPSQAHSGVHSRPTFLHLHFFRHLSVHLQKTSSLQILDALGSIVKRGSYMPLVLIQPSRLVMAVLVQEPGPDPRHVRPGILLVGRAAPGLPLSAGSAGHCCSLQTVCNVLYRYRLWCLFCCKAV